MFGGELSALISDPKTEAYALIYQRDTETYAREIQGMRDLSDNSVYDRAAVDATSNSLSSSSALCARIPNGNLGGEQEGSFFEPQSGRDQQVREKRVARTIAVACSGALGSLDGQATQSDVPKGLVVGQIDKADIGPAGSALVGFVATGNGSATAPV